MSFQFTRLYQQGREHSDPNETLLLNWSVKNKHADFLKDKIFLQSALLMQKPKQDLLTKESVVDMCSLAWRILNTMCQQKHLIKARRAGIRNESHFGYQLQLSKLYKRKGEEEEGKEQQKAMAVFSFSWSQMKSVDNDHCVWCLLYIFSWHYLLIQ